MAEGLEYVCFRVDAREDFAAKFAAKDLGVGLLLAMYCGEKLNGGRIKLAKKWTKNEWLLRVHVAEKLSRSCAGLWRWEGEDLVVDCYDVEVEKRVLSRREKRQGAARARWGTDASADANADANAMQMQSKCNASADAKVMHSREVKVKDIICKAEREVNTDATVEAGAGGGAARALSEKDEGEEFGVWLGALARELPWLAEYRVLPREVAEAARGAYEALPGAAGAAELLGAYYASRLEEDRYRHKFWRPRGGKFFAELGDVMQHAERWDRETGWGAKRRRHAEAEERRQKAAKADEAVEGMSEEEVRRFFNEVRCESKAAEPRGKGGGS